MLKHQSHPVIISDIDNTLLGDADGLNEFLAYLHQADRSFSFGIATGRRLDSARSVLEEWRVAPKPDIFITSVGSEIYYGPNLERDNDWIKHINYGWEPEKLREVLLARFEGLQLQPDIDQREFKVSFFVDQAFEQSLPKLERCLQQNNLLANVIYSHGQFLDLLPIKASKGLAVRHIAARWGLPMRQFLVAGDSGNDEEMLNSDALGVVVGNYSTELEKLKGKPGIYFAKDHYALGILEGIRAFSFL
ncbi:MAG: HAD-IIB family hydrolase [Pseudomonadota bacterium]